MIRQDRRGRGAGGRGQFRVILEHQARGSITLDRLVDGLGHCRNRLVQLAVGNEGNGVPAGFGSVQGQANGPTRIMRGQHVQFVPRCQFAAK